MKKILSIFRRNPNNSKVGDIKAAMIQAAFCGDFVCDEVVDLIQGEDATDKQIHAILFGLSRATASFLKSLETSGVPAKRLYDDMLNVWLDDVNDYGYFDKWIQKLENWRMGLE